MNENCNAAPIATVRNGLIHVECVGCGDRWITPVIEAGAR